MNRHLQRSSMVGRLDLPLNKNTDRKTLCDDALRVLKKYTFLDKENITQHIDASNLVNIICSREDFFQTYKKWFLSSTENEASVLAKIKEMDQDCSDLSSRLVNEYSRQDKKRENSTGSELSRIKGILQAKESLLTTTSDKCDQLSLENQELKAKISSTPRHTACVTKIREHQIKADEAIEDKEKMESALHGAQSAMAELQKQLQKIKDELRTLKNENNSMIDRIAELKQDHVESLQSKNTTMNARKETMDKMTAELKMKDVEMRKMEEIIKKNEIDFKKKEIDFKKKEIELVKRGDELKKKEDDIVIYRKTNSDKLQNLKEKYEKWERSNKDFCDKELKGLKAECQKYKNDVDKANEKIATLSAQCKKYKNDVDKANEKMATLSAQCEKYKNEMDKANEDLTTLSAECEKYKNNVHNANNTIEMMKFEVQALHVNHDTYNSLVAGLEYELQRSDDELNSLKMTLFMAEERMWNTEKLYYQRTSNVEALDSQKTSNESQNDSHLGSPSSIHPEASEHPPTNVPPVDLHTPLETNESEIPSIRNKVKKKKKPKRSSVKDNTMPEYPWICPLCGVSCGLKSTKSRHKLMHSNPNRYKCIDCNIGFYRTDKLNNHLAESGHGKKSTLLESVINDSTVCPDPSLRLS